MELHQLRYFVAVADTGSFTQAARSCFISQPSLSMQIQKLEKELGKALFERLSRETRLSDAGGLFYGRAVAALAAVDEAKASVVHGDDRRCGTVSIAAIPTVAPYLLPRLLKSFLKKHPKSHVVVRECNDRNVVSACTRGEVDVGILAQPVQSERVKVEPLLSDELLVATHKAHRLASKRAIALSDLMDEPFVLLSDVHCLGEHVVAFFREHKNLLAVTCRTTQLQTVQEMVGLKLGISLIPEMAARADTSKACQYRSLSKSKPKRAIVMIRHKTRFQSQLVNEFIRHMKLQC